MTEEMKETQFISVHDDQYGIRKETDYLCLNCGQHLIRVTFLWKGKWKSKILSCECEKDRNFQKINSTEAR